MFHYNLRAHNLPPLSPRYYVDGPADYGDFTSLISQLISNDGIVVAQVGGSPDLQSPAAKNSVMKNRYNFIKGLAQSGFKSIMDYEEVRENIHRNRLSVEIHPNLISASS